MNSRIFTAFRSRLVWLVLNVKCDVLEVSAELCCNLGESFHLGRPQCLFIKNSQNYENSRRTGEAAGVLVMLGFECVLGER